MTNKPLTRTNTDLLGDCTGLSGNLSEIPQDERPAVILDWVKS